MEKTSDSFCNNTPLARCNQHLSDEEACEGKVLEHSSSNGSTKLTALSSQQSPEPVLVSGAEPMPPDGSEPEVKEEYDLPPTNPQGQQGIPPAAAAAVSGFDSSDLASSRFEAARSHQSQHSCEEPSSPPHVHEPPSAAGAAMAENPYSGQKAANKDKDLIAYIEERLSQFILKSTVAPCSMKFDEMTSYHRMLVHRMAALYGLDHHVDHSGKCVIVTKTPHCRVPGFPITCNDLLGSSDGSGRPLLPPGPGGRLLPAEGSKVRDAASDIGVGIPSSSMSAHSGGGRKKSNHRRGGHSGVTNHFNATLPRKPMGGGGFPSRYGANFDKQQQNAPRGPPAPALAGSPGAPSGHFAHNSNFKFRAPSMVGPAFHQPAASAGMGFYPLPPGVGGGGGQNPFGHNMQLQNTATVAALMYRDQLPSLGAQPGLMDHQRHPQSDQPVPFWWLADQHIRPQMGLQHSQQPAFSVHSHFTAQQRAFIAPVIAQSQPSLSAAAAAQMNATVAAAALANQQQAAAAAVFNQQQQAAEYMTRNQQIYYGGSGGLSPAHQYPDQGQQAAAAAAAMGTNMMMQASAAASQQQQHAAYAAAAAANLPSTVTGHKSSPLGNAANSPDEREGSDHVKDQAFRPTPPPPHNANNHTHATSLSNTPVKPAAVVQGDQQPQQTKPTHQQPGVPPQHALLNPYLGGGGGAPSPHQRQFMPAQQQASPGGAGGGNGLVSMAAAAGLHQLHMLSPAALLGGHLHHIPYYSSPGGGGPPSPAPHSIPYYHYPNQVQFVAGPMGQQRPENVPSPGGDHQFPQQQATGLLNYHPPTAASLLQHHMAAATNFVPSPEAAPAAMHPLTGLPPLHHRLPPRGQCMQAGQQQQLPIVAQLSSLSLGDPAPPPPLPQQQQQQISSSAEVSPSTSENGPTCPSGGEEISAKPPSRKPSNAHRGRKSSAPKSLKNRQPADAAAAAASSQKELNNPAAAAAAAVAADSQLITPSSPTSAAHQPVFAATDPCPTATAARDADGRAV